MSGPVTLGGTQWLIGLSWYGFDTEVNRKELMQLADSEPGTSSPVAAYVYKVGFRYVVALARANAYPVGKVGGPPTMAAKDLQPFMPQLAMRAPTVPCAYILEYTEDTYGLCLVDVNRMLLPGSDMLVNELSGIQATLAAYSGIIDEQSVRSLSMADMADMLANAAAVVPDIKRISLVPVSWPHYMRRGAIAALAVVALWAAWYAYQHAYKHKASEQPLFSHSTTKISLAAFVPATTFIATCSKLLLLAPTMLNDEPVAELHCALGGTPAKPLLVATASYVTPESADASALKSSGAPGFETTSPLSALVPAKNKFTPPAVGSLWALQNSLVPDRSPDTLFHWQQVQENYQVTGPLPPWSVAGLPALLSAAQVQFVSISGKPSATGSDAWQFVFSMPLPLNQRNPI